jgi:hypothetical protein
MGRKMKKIGFIILMSMLFSTQALAENVQPYLFGELGATTFQNFDPFPNPHLLGLGGGLQFDKNFAAEIGLTIFGDSTITGPGGSATYKSSSFHPALVGYLPMNQNFQFLGKFGFAHNKERVFLNSISQASYTQNSPYFGLGAQYIYGKSAFRIQYENFGKFDNIPPEISASAVSIGIVVGW